jgi:hypothetical protein
MYFFRRLQDQVPSNVLLAEAIARELRISNDSAYRRLRGETSLTLDEADKLSRHFGVPLQDGADWHNNTVAFNRYSVSATEHGFEKYLETSLSFFTAISRGRDKSGIYAAKDIPVFYYFQFPLLARFKLLFWLRAHATAEDSQHGNITMRTIPEAYLKKGESIAEAYAQVPFTEIWNDETVNSTMRQIHYYHEAGHFEHPDDARHLLQELDQLVCHVQEQAKQGVKLFRGHRCAPYHLYFNEVMLLDNTIHTVVDGVCTTFFSYNNINYLRTADVRFGREIGQWLKEQLEKSTLLSLAGERDRNRLFKGVRRRIQELQGKL